MILFQMVLMLLSVSVKIPVNIPEIEYERIRRIGFKQGRQATRFIQAAVPDLSRTLLQASPCFYGSRTGQRGKVNDVS